MSIINCDIQKLKESGVLLSSIANRYYQQIDNFELMIKRMECWSGPDADRYIDDIKSNIVFYRKLGDELENYALFLIDYSNDIKKVTTKDYMS